MRENIGSDKRIGRLGSGRAEEDGNREVRCLLWHLLLALSPYAIKAHASFRLAFCASYQTLCARRSSLRCQTQAQVKRGTDTCVWTRFGPPSTHADDEFTLNSLTMNTFYKENYISNRSVKHLNRSEIFPSKTEKKELTCQVWTSLSKKLSLKIQTETTTQTVPSPHRLLVKR